MTHTVLRSPRTHRVQIQGSFTFVRLFFSAYSSAVSSFRSFMRTSAPLSTINLTILSWPGRRREHQSRTSLAVFLVQEAVPLHQFPDHVLVPVLAGYMDRSRARLVIQGTIGQLSLFAEEVRATPLTFPPCTSRSSWARGSFFFRLAPFGALAFEAPEPISRCGCEAGAKCLTAARRGAVLADLVGLPHARRRVWLADQAAERHGWGGLGAPCPAVPCPDASRRRHTLV